VDARRTPKRILKASDSVKLGFGRPIEVPSALSSPDARSTGIDLATEPDDASVWVAITSGFGTVDSGGASGVGAGIDATDVEAAGVDAIDEAPGRTLSLMADE
jgi:hypothetical protein